MPKMPKKKLYAPKKNPYEQTGLQNNEPQTQPQKQQKTDKKKHKTRWLWIAGIPMKGFLFEEPSSLRGQQRPAGCVVGVPSGARTAGEIGLQIHRLIHRARGVLAFDGVWFFVWRVVFGGLELFRK